ncbi:chemotaxis protein CheX [Clostridium botulinum]|uniref:Chemotaxis protein CheX n=1 Tax=Clostridium botulinum (strain Okra / Type B1) TaxID=498213 RepID=B1IM57_CLOBK|nr:chemotaxis protein CheX [Clostridium botulinum]EKX79171.1 chemotaxis protein CheX [Clostridium botulinum CFSAN001628]ACA44470.1 chemotaxis protein CheX [Clostridium botulinum B1 str. Okra]MBD5562465.1 chemotaxis protein CheX [Clostridium botulinum]MBD5566200.1 chemotaxis protein CheX [Clostridium botulinum]MBD5569284.1 chemotaxis protein CheX [Clostridium botulinum]
MDAKYINPFIDSFYNVLPQIGFSNVTREDVTIKNNVESLGILINLGIVGDIKGNIVYNIQGENGKKIASKMMMGLPVEELNEMAQSALSELSNMLTANASINFSNIGVNVNISTPTLMYGQDIKIKLNTDKILNIKIVADDIPIDVNVAFEKI